MFSTMFLLNPSSKNLPTMWWTVEPLATVSESKLYKSLLVLPPCFLLSQIWFLLSIYRFFPVFLHTPPPPWTLAVLSNTTMLQPLELHFNAASLEVWKMLTAVEAKIAPSMLSSDFAFYLCLRTHRCIPSFDIFLFVFRNTTISTNFQSATTTTTVLRRRYPSPSSKPSMVLLSQTQTRAPK